MVDYKAKKRRRSIRKRITKAIFYGFLLLVFLFVFYQFYRAYDSNIITEPALEQTVQDIITVDGFAVRNERAIVYSGSGSLSYSAEDSCKIEKGGVLAYLYSDSNSVLLQHRINDLNSKIEQLQEVEQTEGTDPSTLDKHIDEKLIKTLSVINSGSTEGLNDASNKLLTVMNKRQIVTDENDLELIKKRVAELKQQAKELSEQLGEPINTISADSAGYFSTKIDGCESLIDYETVTQMKPEQFELLPEIIDSRPPTNAVGRIIEDYRWYYVFEIPMEKLSQFKVGMKIDVKFSDMSTDHVTMNLIAVNSSDTPGNGMTLGVLRCTDISKELISLRRETAQLVINSHTGLRVSTRAVHYNELNQMGVYTVVGNISRFKRINPIYTSDNYIICGEPEQQTAEDGEQKDTQDSDDEKYDYLEKYDEVIVEGKDLTDGKVVKG